MDLIPKNGQILQYNDWLAVKQYSNYSKLFIKLLKCEEIQK